MSLVTLASQKRLSCIALLASLIVATVPSGARAQGATTFKACTQGSLADCAIIELASGTHLGTNFFAIAVQNLGSTTNPSVATTIYNLVFDNGGASNPAAVDAPIAPIVINGPQVTGTNWDLFDATSSIFLSALDGRGVGSCVAGPDVGGFGQAGNTCANQFQVFAFKTTTLYNPFSYQLTDLEVAGLTSDPTLQADSCGDPSAPCAITPITSTPEPASVLLALTGFSALAGLGLRRRRAVSSMGH